MKRALPPYVYRKVAKGKAYHYFDKNGVRANVDPSASTFWADYARLLDAKPIFTGKRTWKALIARYRRHDRFKKLKPRTVKDYEPVLAFITDRYGNLDPAAMRKVHIVDQQDALSGKFARDFVNVISVLLWVATEIGWRDDNPAREIARKEPETKKPHVVWTDAAVAKFRAEASALPLLIFELAMGTVQRPDDLTRFDWEHFDGKEMRLTQSKTDKDMVVPCSDPLIAALQAAKPKVRLIGGTPILQTRGRRMTYRRMAEIMLAERRRLGLEAFDLHALRYRGVQELTWAGCTDDEIASYSGHASKTMIRKYAGAARQIMRARQANQKRRNRTGEERES